MGEFSNTFEVEQRIKLIGQRIRIARIRRGWTIVELAAKAGINRNTLNALELGKPGVATGALLSVLWALGLDHTLNAVADPDLDIHGKALETSRRPQRARKSQNTNDYDF